MTINVFNGPNLGRLGKRQPEVYGSTTHDDLVAIIERSAGRPRLCGWRENHPRETINLLPGSSIVDIAVSEQFWDYLGNRQPKVADSHSAERWDDPDRAAAYR